MIVAAAASSCADGGRFWLSLALLLSILTARDLQAQSSELSVRVVSSNGLALSGALVGLVNSSNVVVAEGLTSESGSRTLPAPAGSYRVRVRRIGFQPFFSDAVTIPRTGDFVVRVDDRRVVLSSIVITASNRCGKFERNSESLAIVWEEISKALLSSQLTGSDLESLGRARIYRKQVDAGGVVLSSDTTYMRIQDRKPFSAVDPAILASEGYVRGNQRKGWEYFGVDESILLSSAFTTTHCFRLMKGSDRPGQIGMAFEPAPGQRKPDVKGVLWLDEKASELRDVVFYFTNAGLLTRFDAGGSTKFRRLPSGAWIVEEWKLRAPKLTIISAGRENAYVTGYVEDGGGVVVSTMLRAGNRRTGVLRGVVFDSLAMRAIAGATVTTSGAVASSDTIGRFAFTDIPLEEQTVTFSHPSFSSLGFVALERSVILSRDTTDVLLSTPSLKTLWIRLCGDTTVKIRSSWSEAGLMHGTVRDTLGNPVEGAVVKMFWSESTPSTGNKIGPSELMQQVTTDGAGFYAVCGFTRTSRGTAFAVFDSNQTTRRPFDFTSEGILRRDLSFSSITPVLETRTNEISVTVTDAAGGVLGDAMVFVEGSTQMSRTDDAGMAIVRSRDKQAVIGVRRLGFSEQSLRISLGPNTRHRLRVTLNAVQTLPTVPVRADAMLPRDLERRRNQGGTGSFFGREELDRVGAVKNLLTRVPFARIDSRQAGRWALFFPGPNGGECAADLYVDGVLSAPGSGSAYEKFEEIETLSPEAVAAVEVYPRVGQAPQNIVRLRDGCGVILVWTKFWAESQQSSRASLPISDSLKTKR